LGPHVVEGRPPAELPVLEAGALLFRSQAVSWPDWVAAWQRDQAGKGPPGPVVPGVRVLPTGPSGLA
jgi:hypothetical protein